MKLWRIGMLTAVMLMIGSALFAQQPQSYTAPTYAVNAKYVNGASGGGYAPCANAASNCSTTTGLNLLVGPGTANCGSGTIVTYAGGTFTLAASTTYHLYLNTSSSCAPAVKTTGFTGSDIPLAVVVTGASSITSISDDRTMFFPAGSVSSGVTSFNTRTGAVVLNQSDVNGVGTISNNTTGNAATASALAAAPSLCSSGQAPRGIVANGNATDCQAVGGGGGSLIPSNANFAYLGDSFFDDDLHFQSSPIAVTSYTVGGSSISFNNSGTNGLSVGDWINLRFLTGWPAAPSNFAAGNGYSIFQVSATGLSSTTFQIASLPIGTVTSCGSSCGNAYSAMNYVPFLTAQSLNMPSGAINNTYEYVTNMQQLSTNFSGLLGALAPGTTGKPLYIVLGGYGNDILDGQSGSTIIGYLESIYSQAHTMGAVVVATSPISFGLDQESCGCPEGFAYYEQVKQWIYGAGETLTNKASGQYWDIFSDEAETFTDASNSTLYETSQALTPGGNKLFANRVSTDMYTGNGIPNQKWTGDFYGTGSGIFPAGQNGRMYVPGIDGSWAFQWWNNERTYPIMYMAANPSADGAVVIPGLENALIVANQTDCPGNNPFCVGNNGLWIETDGSLVTNGAVRIQAQAAASSYNCLQIDTAGTVTKTGSPCGMGSGTVTSFAAPAGSWPSWLVPTVSTATTTPSLAVAASAIPIAAVGSAGLSGTSPISIASTGAISCSTCLTALTGTVLLAPSGAQTITQPVNTNFTVAGSGTSVADFSGMPQFKLPVVPGYTPTASGECGHDSTAHNFLCYDNAASNFVALFPSASPPMSGHVAGFLETGSTWTLEDLGAYLPMVYPGAGIGNSTGSAWGTSYGASGTGTSLLTNVSPVATGTPDFSGAIQFKLPVVAGYSAAASGEIGHDSTNHNWHVWANGADNFLALFPSGSVPTSGHVAGFLETSSVWTLEDLGALPVAPTIQTNSSNNSTQTTLNFETSTTNAVGLTVTPSNPSGGIEKLEITGSSYTGNAATATSAPMSFQLLNQAMLATPAANTTVWSGMGGTPGGTVANMPVWKAPRACTLNYFNINVYVAGTEDTGANSILITVYDVTTSTSFTDTQVSLNAEARVANGSVTPSDSVASGDKLILQEVLPASWTTQPTNMWFNANLVCK